MMIGIDEKVEMEDLKTMRVTREGDEPQPSFNVLEIKIAEANGAEVMWFYGKIGITPLKIIADTGAAANCCGGEIYRQIRERKIFPKWIQRNPIVKVQGANGAALEVLGEIELCLTLGDKEVPIRAFC
jgi:hypothetical protein